MNAPRRPPRLHPRRLRGAGRALLAILGLVAPLAAAPADATPAPAPPIQRLADIRARLLAQDERLADSEQTSTDGTAPADAVAQWFNWPNWTNWANWNNWDNWNNWVKWSKF